MGISSMRTGQTPAAATELFALRSGKNGGGEGQQRKTVWRKGRRVQGAWHGQYSLQCPATITK